MSQNKIIEIELLVDLSTCNLSKGAKGTLYATYSDVLNSNYSILNNLDIPYTTYDITFHNPINGNIVVYGIKREEFSIISSSDNEETDTSVLVLNEKDMSIKKACERDIKKALDIDIIVNKTSSNTLGFYFQFYGVCYNLNNNLSSVVSTDTSQVVKPLPPFISFETASRVAAALEYTKSKELREYK